MCVWQEDVGSCVAEAADDLKRVVLEEIADVKQAVSDAADEVVDGVEIMLREDE